MGKARFQLEFRAFGAVLLSILATVVALFGPLPARADQTVSEEALVRELEARMDRVDQFRFMRREAEKLGVKVYLFGGTAAGFAHYVRWDMLRERGDQSYQKEFFDYDFFSIYRSTQDLDVVVDGPADKAAELGRRLREKFPNFQGAKDSWEVRLLRETVGDKRALLGDADFNKQHSDSNSTGLIEVTRSGEAKVRDLRNWDEPRSRFLQDIAQAKISYYFSPEHETTIRYGQGKNPPLYSVIRFLTKAFQYDLELRTEDVAVIRKIIDSFDPSNPGRGIKLDANDFEYWIHGNDQKVSNAKKLFQHAVDVERAWNVLEELGLRAKLIALKAPKGQTDTLAQLMDREPLRSKPVGLGRGKTAADLKIDVVAHETNLPLALESITRSKRGSVNAFISRDGKTGEAAAYGNGFYTKVGHEGARGTGLTIKFRLDPKARLGSDFTLEKGIDYLVVLNKNALTIIPESLDANLEDWYRAMKIAGPRNLGAMLRLDRRLLTKWQATSPAEKVKIRKSIAADLRADLKAPMSEETAGMLSAWFRQPMTSLFIDEAIEFVKVNPAGFHLSSFMALDHFRKHKDLPKLVDALLSHQNSEWVFSQDWFARLLAHPDTVARPEWLGWMKTGKVGYQPAMHVASVLASEAPMAHPAWAELVEHHIRQGNQVLWTLASAPGFENTPRWEKWMTLVFDPSTPYVKSAGKMLHSERALKDPRWWSWVDAYTRKAYEAKDGFSQFANEMGHGSIAKDARWITWAKSVLTLPDNDREIYERYQGRGRYETDLDYAKGAIALEITREPHLIASDLVETVFRDGGNYASSNLQYNYLDKPANADRADRFVMWMKHVKRKGAAPPRGSWDTFRNFQGHPAFKGVVPFTPGWVFALVDKGWEMRDGKFQAPERSKPVLPFMKKPVSCPALFVK